MNLSAVANHLANNAAAATAAGTNDSEDPNAQADFMDEQDIAEDNTIYFIKLPVVNNCTQNNLKSSTMKLYFFFKSKLP